MRPRHLALSLLLLISSACSAEPLNALVVIPAGLPKPGLDPLYVGHFQTMLWPAEFDQGDNRLLSLLSGEDWRGEHADASFLPPPAGRRGFVAVHYESLLRRGYLSRRSRWLEGTPVYAVSSPVGVGSANPHALLLALGASSPEVVPVPYFGPWPEHGLLVYEADSWEHAQDVGQRVGGRALVVEVPSAKFSTGGNFYLMGRGWPAGTGAGLPLDPSTGVAGLVRARSSAKLLLHPESFAWHDVPDARDVAWRWFPFVREGGFILLIAGMTLLAGVIGLATYAISLEKRGKLAATLLLAAGLVPAALLASGSLDRRLGLENYLSWFVLAIVVVGLSVTGVHLVVRKAFPGTHPLLAASVVGLVACVLGDPKWSILSGLFGFNISQSAPEAMGAFVAYLTGVVAFSRQSNAAAAWFGRAAVVAILAVGLLGDGWWAPGRVEAVLLPLVALVCGEGWMRWPWLFILALVPNDRTDVVHHGFSWTPLGCLTDARGSGAVNLFDYVTFAVYPGLWAMGLIVLYVFVFGSGFVMRQFRVVLQQDPRTRSLPWAVLALTAAGFFNPGLLPGAVFVAFGALITLFYTAVWSL